MMRSIVSAAVLLAALPACPGVASAELTSSEVAKKLDVMSFPNSIHQMSRPGARTFAQYGFTQVVPTEGKAGSVDVYQPDHRWLFQIMVLGRKGDDVTACVLEQALNGGTYLGQTPLALRRGRDGLLHATGQAVSDPHCDDYAR